MGAQTGTTIAGLDLRGADVSDFCEPESEKTGDLELGANTGAFTLDENEDGLGACGSEGRGRRDDSTIEVFGVKMRKDSTG